MHGVLRQVKKTSDEVCFEIIDSHPLKNLEQKLHMEYVLLKISGQGLRLGRKLQKNEFIADFSSSNILCAANDMVYVLPDIDLDEIFLENKFPNYKKSQKKSY